MDKKIHTLDDMSVYVSEGYIFTNDGETVNVWVGSLDAATKHASFSNYRLDTEEKFRAACEGYIDSMRQESENYLREISR